jgi:hypothetical protein
MLTVDQCKHYLQRTNLTDEQVEAIRDFLYKISVTIIKKYENSHTATK